MKKISILMVAAFCVSQVSFAQGTSEEANIDHELDSESAGISVELSAQTFGDFGSKSLKTFSDITDRSTSQYSPTDGILSVTVRKELSYEWDVSLTAPIVSHTSGVSTQASATTYGEIALYPVSLGMRYHVNTLHESVRPFVQVDLGEAIISDKTVYGAGGNDDAYDRSFYLKPFAKITAGANFYFSPRSPVYVGLKAGYLAMSEFGSVMTGLDVGYSF